MISDDQPRLHASSMNAIDALGVSSDATALDGSPNADVIAEPNMLGEPRTEQMLGADRLGYARDFAESVMDHCTPAVRYESLYCNAEDDSDRVPWTVGRSNPQLVSWLNREACCIVRPGARAVVVGCGLGDDVVELFRRGYDVVGFDISPTAVKWAARRHPAIADRLIHADLMNPPGRFLARFDLVIEIDTLDAVEPDLQPIAAKGIARLLAPRGVALIMCRAKEPADPGTGAAGATSDEDESSAAAQYIEGPPFPMTGCELTKLLTQCGLEPRGNIEPFWDAGETPRPYFRGLFTRP